MYPRYAVLLMDGAELAVAQIAPQPSLKKCFLMGRHHSVRLGPYTRRMSEETPGR